MSDYVPPLEDIRFALSHVADLAALATLPGYEHADPATVAGVLEEAGRFFAEQFAPLNRVGDVQHSRRNEDGSVTTPDGFAKAYQRYVEAGWPAVPFPPEYGGGGFPWLVGVAMQEFLTASNMGFSLCPLLTQGAIDMLLHYGSEAQREVYLPKMVTGEWTGTMNLTEPQAGSDVGALTTRAVPADDGVVADHRAEDLHHVRRARPGRQHRPPRARPGARRAARHDGASRASSCRSSSSATTARSARATRSSASRSSTRWASTPRRRA